MACVLVLGACGEQTLTTGGQAELTASLDFVPNKEELSQTIDFASQGDLAALKGQVKCGYLDPTASYISLEKFTGGAGAPWTLEVSLVIGADTVSLLSARGTLTTSQRDITFAQPEAGLLRAGEERLATALMLNAGASSVTFRYSFSVDGDPVVSAQFQVVTVMRFETADGPTCPSPTGK